MLKTQSPKPIRVAMFCRGRHTGYYSIEKVFETVRDALPPHLETRTVALPVHAQGFWRRVYCLAYGWVHRSAVNHITGDISFVAPALPGARTVVTVHDFGRLHQLSGIRAAVFKFLYFTVPFRHCKYITTISQQVARELGELFPWAARKTLVIPDCVPVGFTYIPRDFHYERPAVLQIGTKPNKNIERLIHALEGQECELHIVGAITAEQRKLLASCSIRYRNSVDITEAELRSAYAEADIVSFVSTYEGFGLPILEANAVGRPVITSNIPPMSDVAGRAARLVDPNDIQSIRAGLAHIIGDAKYRTELVANGFDNVSRYSAVDIAAQFAALYEIVGAELVGQQWSPRKTSCESSTL